MCCEERKKSLEEAGISGSLLLWTEAVGVFTILNSDRGSARYNTHELPQAASNHFPDSMFQTFIMSECYLCSSPSFYQFRAPARRWLVFTSQAKPQILPQMANCCHSFLCVCACVYGWPFFSFPVIHCKKKGILGTVCPWEEAFGLSGGQRQKDSWPHTWYPPQGVMN